MPLQVRIASLVFNGFKTDEREGFYVEQEGLVGWTDGLDVRRNVTERPQAHGDFDVPGFLAARDVTIKGFFLANSTEKLKWMQAALTGLLADGGSSPVVVNDEGITTFGRARLGDMTKVKSIRGGGTVGRYSLNLYFANPRLFGEFRTSPAFLPIANYGNFGAAPVHTVFGDAPSGYQIAGVSGRVFTVTRPLLPGVPHVVDMANGYLREAGVIVYGGISRGDTWVVPAGGQVTHTIFAPSGFAELSTLVRDTYV